MTGTSSTWIAPSAPPGLGCTPSAPRSTAAGRGCRCQRAQVHERAHLPRAGRAAGTFQRLCVRLLAGMRAVALARNPTCAERPGTHHRRVLQRCNRASRRVHDVATGCTGSPHPSERQLRQTDYVAFIDVPGAGELILGCADLAAPARRQRCSVGGRGGRWRAWGRVLQENKDWPQTAASGEVCRRPRA